MIRHLLLASTAAALIAAPALAQTSGSTSQAPNHSTTSPSASSTSSSARMSTQEFVRRAEMSDRFEIASSRLAQQQGHSEAVKNFASEMVRDHTRTSQELMELTRRLGPAVMSQAGQPGMQTSQAGTSGSSQGSMSASSSRAGASGTTGSASGGSSQGNGASSGMANNSRSGSAGGTTTAQSGTASGQAGSSGMTTAQGGMQAEGMDPQHQQLMQRMQQARGAEFDRLYMQAQVQAHQEAVQMFTTYSQSGDQAELKQWAAKTLPSLQQHLQRAQQLQKGL